MHDALGDRMKKRYENSTKYYLPCRTYTIIRIDGKAFHSFTRGCEKPFDAGLIGCMNEAAKYLCDQISGTVFAYTQSDEISLLLTDFARIQTEPWFGGNVQKIASVSASLATVGFNQHALNTILRQRLARGDDASFASFDSRVFTIPDPVEVDNYFRWRQADCVRNSVSMVAQSLFSHKQLHQKSVADMQNMIAENGKRWDDYPNSIKYGRVVVRAQEERDISFTKSNGEVITKRGVKRKYWLVEDAPYFIDSPGYLQNLIPQRYKYED